MVMRSNQLVTLFGGGGFVGRYVCETLLRQGVRVRVAQRDPRRAYTLKPLAQVGQLGLEVADIANRGSVDNAVRGADAVINLCGVFGRAMSAVHVDGARHVAEAAAAAGASALVHISAIGADAASPSAYGRTKAAGEAAVGHAFAGATIIRPSLVFGPEDRLTNRFAALGRFPIVPVIAANTRFQPVYVRDLARGIALAALDPVTHGGKTYEIGGPQALTMIDLHRAIFAVTGQSPDLIPLPDAVASAMSRLGFLPGAPLTRDQWLMLQQDNVPAIGTPGLAAFGIDPAPLAAVGSEWLGRFNRAARFSGRKIHLTPAG